MENTITSGEQDQTYSMSWLAYIRPFFTFLIIGIIGFALSNSMTTAISIIGYIVIIFSVVFLILRFIYLKTLRLFINEDGVYLFRGIFPWTKGITGTTWRDISDANYYTGLISWASTSYRVRIGHRFTKTSELIIPHIKNGNNAVVIINETINKKYKDMS